MRFGQGLLIILFLFLISGCSGRINEDKFVLVFTDLVIAQDSLGSNFKQEAVKKAVFKKYNITPKEYDATLAYYNSNPKKWDRFFNKAIAHLEELKGKKKS